MLLRCSWAVCSHTTDVTPPASMLFQLCISIQYSRALLSDADVWWRFCLVQLRRDAVLWVVLL